MSPPLTDSSCCHSEDDGNVDGNPMVSAFKEDLEGEEQELSTPQSPDVSRPHRVAAEANGAPSESSLTQMPLFAATATSEAGSEAGSSKDGSKEGSTKGTAEIGKTRRTRKREEGKRTETGKGRKAGTSKKKSEDEDKRKLEDFLGPAGHTVDGSQYELF